MVELDWTTTHLVDGQQLVLFVRDFSASNNPNMYVQRFLDMRRHYSSNYKHKTSPAVFILEEFFYLFDELFFFGLLGRQGRQRIRLLHRLGPRVSNPFVRLGVRRGVNQHAGIYDQSTRAILIWPELCGEFDRLIGTLLHEICHAFLILFAEGGDASRHTHSRVFYNLCQGLCDRIMAWIPEWLSSNVHDWYDYDDGTARDDADVEGMWRAQEIERESLETGQNMW
jgi:hypothetical protein